MLWGAYVKEQSKFMVKIYNFDIEAKGQGHTEIMKICYTLSNGDTLMCQIRYDDSKVQKALV